MAKVSRARDLFDQILTDPAKHLGRMVADHARETEYVEFKGGKSREKDTKHAWSQALSGFANTEGGVLVWGIRAAKSPSAGGGRSIDAASELQLVPNPHEFEQLLRDVHLAATVPPLRGVEIRGVPAPAGGGFVVCFVPEGDDKPYRADFDESKGYFQRVCDSFVPIQHSLLRSLFYPRARPDLVADVHIRRADHGGSIHFTVMLRNDGNASARDMFLTASTVEPIETMTAPSEFWHAQISTGIAQQVGANNPGRLQAITSQSLHPGQQVTACLIEWARTIVIQGKPLAVAELEGLELRVSVFMADQEPQVFDGSITADSFQTGRVIRLKRLVAFAA